MCPLVAAKQSTSSAWTRPHTDLDETEKELEYLIASPNNGVLAFVMQLSSSGATSPQHDVGKVIGRMGTRSSEQAVIGYVLNRSYWGKGYMNEALTVLLRYLWEYGVQRIMAQVDPRNERSMNVLKKLRFRETGRKEKVREVDEVEHGIVYFALEKEKGDNQSVE